MSGTEGDEQQRTERRGCKDRGADPAKRASTTALVATIGLITFTQKRYLPEASNDTFDLIRVAQSGARKIFRAGHRYAKAGIIMNDLVPARSQQRPLFDARDRDQSDRLMTALDAVNTKFGRGALVPASSGIKREWQTKFDRQSPRYTTNIKELPIAMAR